MNHEDFSTVSTPLFSALQKEADSGRTSFHMPGNRGGKAFPSPFSSGFAGLESTELEINDDLNEPTGPALLAEEKAAAFFGAGKSLFFTSGSTVAIYAMLATALPPGSRVAASATLHRAFAQAAALLDLEMVFLPMTVPKRGADGGGDSPSLLRSPLPVIDTPRALKLLEKTEGLRALICSAPDYYGHVDLPQELLEAAHARGLPVLCDEAHGAAFAAAVEIFPKTALARGVDLCVQSAHKTLPALAPASLLHLSHSYLRRCPEAARRAVAARKLFQTSSPSFPIGASLDFARAYLESAECREKIQLLLDHITFLRQELPPAFQVLPAGPEDDPLRLVISCRSSGFSLRELSSGLSSLGIDIEMADFSRLVLIPSLDQPREDFMRLSAALRKLSLEHKGDGRAEKPGVACREEGSAARAEEDLQRWLCRPRAFLKPRAATFRGLFSKVDWPGVMSEQGEGDESLRVTSVIAPYPPGIPLWLPGEQITRRDLLRLLDLQAEGLHIPPFTLEKLSE